MMTIQDKLVLLRKKKGWSQEDLAEKIDVSRQAISRWENGTALPDAENLRQLSHLYEVSTDYLLNDELESNDDLPQEKTDEETICIIDKKQLLCWLIASVAFVIATIGFLSLGIDRQSVVYVMLSMWAAVNAATCAILYVIKKNKA
ncbi:MAG: helix-turn-helix transcriptional regulator [Lachnospiraceae bacterium]|nr:helix-turn-helix transcriptional regulator [Lachnospiraceae bacterium]